MAMQAGLERPLTAYVPYFTQGMMLATCRAANAEPIFGPAATAHLLHSVLRQVKARFFFRMVGFVILPDHVHLLIRPGAGTPAGQVVAAMVRRYQRQYAQVMGIPTTLQVWDRRQEIVPVRDVAAFAHCLDTLHYDPVFHGLVARPEEWLESSYGAWMERGLYRLGWGWQRPQRLQET